MEDLKTNEKAKEETPKAQAPKVVERRKMSYQLAEGSRLELNGLPIGILTNDRLKDPNVIVAIQNYEQRTGRQVIGTLIVLA